MPDDGGECGAHWEILYLQAAGQNRSQRSSPLDRDGCVNVYRVP